MWTCQAPVADMLHLLTRLHDAPASWAAQPAFADLDTDTAAEVLAQAGRFAGEVLAPTNAPGDQHGCTWSPAGVTTPPGFRAAHQAFVDGGWPALACHPDAGGQGLVRTQATVVAGEPANGVPVQVSGSKIFISGGDQDLTDNIVHLVLCRLAGAPAGTKGLSLALVPKLRPDGTRNGVVCDGIEHKMGIHGSATCQMRFDGADGWLIGTPHRGLAAMFLMMNAARLHVAMQGVGHLGAATQNAWRHAHERLQMRAAARSPGAAPRPGPDPIAWHPAMCRTLPALQPFADGLAQQLAQWALALVALQAARTADPEQPLRVADDVLAGVGHALLAWAWARIARTALQADQPPVPGARSAAQWLQSATFGLQWLLPQAQVHWQRATQPGLALPFLAA